MKKGLKGPRRQAGSIQDGSTLTKDKCTFSEINFSLSEYCRAVNRPKYLGRTFDHDGKPYHILDDDLEDIFSRSDFAGKRRR